MLEWTAAGEGARLKMFMRHDDEQREYAYGPGGGLPGTTAGDFQWSVHPIKRIANNALRIEIQCIQADGRIHFHDARSTRLASLPPALRAACAEQVES